MASHRIDGKESKTRFVKARRNKGRGKPVKTGSQWHKSMVKARRRAMTEKENSHEAF